MAEPTYHARGHHAAILVAIVTLGSVAVLAGSSLLAMRSARSAGARQQATADILIRVERLQAAFEREVATGRGFLFSGASEFLAREREARLELAAQLGALRQATDEPQVRRLVADVERSENTYAELMSRAAAGRRAAASHAEVEALFEQWCLPARHAVNFALRALEDDRRGALAETRLIAAVGADRATRGAWVISILALGATLLMMIIQVRVSRRERAALERWAMMLSVASHDIKTPLTTLSLKAQLIRRLATGTPELRQIARGMEQQVARMADLVGGILDLSRLQLGPLTPERETVDLTALVCGAVERLGEQFEQEGMPITVAAPGAVLGSWDRVRLEQVIGNLLSNALKFGAPGPVEVTIGADTATARLVVRDHGVGIALDEQARIFERFARAEGARRPGHGLGLWITQTIVAAHGGRIAVDSRPGDGATFTVELPRWPESGPPATGWLDAARIDATPHPAP